MLVEEARTWEVEALLPLRRLCHQNQISSRRHATVDDPQITRRTKENLVQASELKITGLSSTRKLPRMKDIPKGDSRHLNMLEIGFRQV